MPFRGRFRVKVRVKECHLEVRFRIRVRVKEWHLGRVWFSQSVKWSGMGGNISIK